MPGTDGLTLCRALKNNPDYGDVSIVALTGGDYPEELTGLCDVFLRKPIDVPRLLDTLEQLQTAKLLSTATTSAQALRW
jgi:CheY-like chemotaxis protein